MIDTKSDPGAWADEIARTGKFRAVEDEGVYAAGTYVSSRDAELARLRSTTARLLDIINLHCDSYLMRPDDIEFLRELRQEVDGE
jgi:hypothetical protein